MFSYLFTYRQSTKDRYQNLLTVLDWLNYFNKEIIFEVIIVEQDNESKLEIDKEKYHYPIKHVFAFNPQLFNRSWGFNIAVKNAIYDKLFFADSDMIVNHEFIIQAVVALDKDYDVISPFKSLIDLTLDETNSLNLNSFTYNIDRPHRGGMNFCSGIVAYTKKVHETVYGWDERFEGWGGEDDIQLFKLSQLCKLGMLNNNCFHLHHQRSKLDGTNQHPKYRNNLALFWHYNNNRKAILEDMKKNIKNGNLKKYK